ncbi:hypothetical protein MF672_039100 [Actinomadura sp. ATCC 31491]|uniref:Uncharacterized protein n=1 Tax=Actinomadura luzonensis TaxID=2805427 RepID=A0ABT0G6N7_9ACTN|nr:hypothetical protein [Actinomadura luzonensis]MCK2219763.1 hypothetical protein [Actinomadura luzonensis]
MAGPVLNARIGDRGRQPLAIRLSVSRRYNDPLAPYISAIEADVPYPGGPLVSRALLVLPDGMTDHVNAVALEFTETRDVDALMELLPELRRLLAQRYPSEDEMEAPY